jgi:hypothetical protein
MSEHVLFAESTQMVEDIIHSLIRGKWLNGLPVSEIILVLMGWSEDISQEPDNPSDHLRWC